MQMTLVAIAFVVALGYVARQTWRTWAEQKCASGCGCAATKARPTLISTEELTLRVRQR